MTHDRNPLSQACRVLLAAILLAFIPLAAAAQAAIACTQVFWNGSVQDPEDASFYWKADDPQMTNWDNHASPLTAQEVSNYDTLIFPDQVENKYATNDFGVDALELTGIEFRNSTGYLVNGDSIRLDNGILTSGQAGENTIDTDIELTADQYFDIGGTSLLTISGALSDSIGKAASSEVAPANVTCDDIDLYKKGSGTLALTSEKNTFAGSIWVLDGTLTLGSHVTARSLYLNPGNFQQANYYQPPTSPITLKVMLDDPTVYSLAIVSGTNAAVVLNNAVLDLHSANLPVSDQTYTIIDNRGTKAIQGTFFEFANGAKVQSKEGDWFTISYTGGDGNDVVLTPVYSYLFLPRIFRNHLSLTPEE